MDLSILPISNLLQIHQLRSGGFTSGSAASHWSPPREVENPLLSECMYSILREWHGFQAHRRVKFIACGLRVNNIWYILVLFASWLVCLTPRLTGLEAGGLSGNFTSMLFAEAWVRCLNSVDGGKGPPSHTITNNV